MRVLLNKHRGTGGRDLVPAYMSVMVGRFLCFFFMVVPFGRFSLSSFLGAYGVQGG